MRTFRLTNGYTVNTVTYPEFTEFETRDPEGAAISFVCRKGADADELMTSLRVLDALQGA